MQHNLPHGRREIAQGLSSRASLSHGARPRGLFMTLAALLRSLLAMLALAAVAWVAFWWPRGHQALALLGALLIVLPHAPLMALEFVLLRRANLGDPAPTPRAGELLRAWADEVVGAVQVFGWQQPFRSQRFADHLPADAAGRRGLLLVHGFVCNRGLWNPWWPRLLDAGVPCVALNLQPVFGSIDDYADAIDAAVRRLSDATGRPPLLVGHSMGGLAIRAWLRQHAGHARVHGAITVGTPHRGTWLGRFAFSANGVQMRWDSPWLGGLASQASTTHAPGVLRHDTREHRPLPPSPPSAAREAAWPRAAPAPAAAALSLPLWQPLWSRTTPSRRRRRQPPRPFRPLPPRRKTSAPT